MIIEQSEQVMKEIKKVFIGKDEIIEKGTDGYLRRWSYPS